MVGVDIQKIQEMYEALSEKYSVSTREVEMYFIETLSEFYNTGDIFFTGTGAIIDGKYRNLRKKDFSNIIDIFTMKCNDAGNKKNLLAVKSILVQKNGILYAKIMEDRGYSYIVQPMINKERKVEEIPPLEIPKKGIIVPSYIKFIPIEIKLKSLRIHNNKIIGSAFLFTKKVASFHLQKILQNYEKDSIFLNMWVKHQKDDLLIIGSGTNPKPSGQMIGNILQYFRNFGLECHIKQTEGGSHA